MYLVIILLCLQVIKNLLSRSEWEYAWFSSTVILAIQFLLLLLVPLFIIFRFLFRRRFPGKAGLPGFLSAIGVVVLLELLFTYWLHHPSRIPGVLNESYKYYYFQYDFHIAQYDDRISTYNDQLFYTMKPGIKGFFANAEFKNRVESNGQGLRDDEGSLIQPAVICLGDSFTWGWGVEQEQTYPQFIEKHTGRKVLNAGISSYGTAREIINLSLLDRSKLEYLVVQYCGNDITENNQFNQDGHRLKISSESEYRKLTRSHRNAMIYFPGKNFLLIGQIFLKKMINKIFPLFSFSDLTGYNDLVSPQACTSFLEVLSKAPVDFSKVKIIVFHLDPQPVLNNRFARLTDSLARTAPYDTLFRNNLQIVDMSGIIKKEDFYLLDRHLRPSGQLKVAEVIDSLISHSSKTPFGPHTSQ